MEKYWVMGHVPYRNWFPVCVMAKGREMGHESREKDMRLPEYSFDYCFPGDEMGYKWNKIAGPQFWTFNGKTLYELSKEL
mgnify:CR=1 FL=1